MRSWRRDSLWCLLLMVGAASGEIAKEPVESARAAIVGEVLKSHSPRCLPSGLWLGLAGADVAQLPALGALIAPTAAKANSPEWVRLINLQLSAELVARTRDDASKVALHAALPTPDPAFEKLCASNPALAAATLGAILRAGRMCGQTDAERAAWLKAGASLRSPHRYPAQDVQAVLVLGLADIALGSGDAAWLTSADTAFRELTARFGAPDGSFFLSEAKSKPAPRESAPRESAQRGASLVDGVSLSGNATAALAALRLATKLPGYLDQARRCVEATLPKAKPTPEFAGLWLAATKLLAQQGATPVIGPLVLTPAPRETPKPEAGRSASDSDAHVRMTVGLDKQLAWGASVPLTVKLAIADGWHLFARQPKNDDDAAATRLRFEYPKGFDVSAVEFPKGEPAQIAGYGEVMVYTGTLVLHVTLKTPKQPKADAQLRLIARYQACSAEMCAQSAKLSVALPLK